MRAPEVPHSAELDRILSVPRRVWTPESVQPLVKAMTARLRTPNGTWTLRPHQALALFEFWQIGGGLLVIPVDGGKTLISFLAPVVVGAKNPLLITKGSLIKSGKTAQEFAELAQQWRSPAPITTVSFTRMAREDAEHFLTEGQFDCILIDEAHGARNIGAAVTKRIERYKVAQAQKGIHVPVLAMTGTFYRKSLDNLRYLMSWTLGDYASIPWKDAREMHRWKRALDWQVPPGQRLWPGAILELARGYLSPEKIQSMRAGSPTMIPSVALTAAREALQRWMAETPGVIILNESDCDKPIRIRFRLPPYDQLLEETFQKFRATQRTPDGWLMPEAIVRYAHEKEIGAGVYNIIDPRPPEEWATARREINTYVKDKIDSSQRSANPVDTEQQVMRRFPDAPAVARWRELKPTFKPRSKAVWLSASVLHWAAQWVTKNGPALVWVQNIAVGEMLSKLTGIPFYSSDGLSEDGRSIIDARPPASAIVSTHAIREGFQLHYWGRALMIGWTQPADQVEQIIGRQHRKKQQNDVEIDVLVLSGETLRAFAMSYAESLQVREILSSKYKLLSAELDYTDLGYYGTLSQTQSRFVYKEPDLD